MIKYDRTKKTQAFIDATSEQIIEKLVELGLYPCPERWKKLKNNMKEKINVIKNQKNINKTN